MANFSRKDFGIPLKRVLMADEDSFHYFFIQDPEKIL